MTWTDERIAELMKLWQQGLSAAEIGRELGVSKNAVVGKAHRLKLPSRPSPIKRQPGGPRRRSTPRPKAARRKAAKPKSGPRLRSRPAPVAPRPVMRLDPKGSKCLWPIGDPGDPDFHFCGEISVEGKPYCPDHCARAYITRTRDSQAA